MRARNFIVYRFYNFVVAKYFFSSLPSKIWMRWVSLYLASAIGSIAAQYGDDG